MGVSLAKEHSAADWSVRPLPQEWLTYAALDVELLIELRDKVESLLTDAKKENWAKEEFASILLAPPLPPRVDPWRRTSGMHKVKRGNQLAIIRELWNARDEIAKAQDIAGGKLLNDSAIVEIALNPPTNKKEFEKVLRPIGLRARWLENLKAWLDAVARAVALEESEWPALRTNADTLPPIKLWRDKFPEKYAPLSHARARIEIIAQENCIPIENLITPELVRRICWSAPAPSTVEFSPLIVRQHLQELGARRWQVELVAEAIAQALLEKEPLPTPEPVPETTPQEA
jgi:ribonuclease D